MHHGEVCHGALGVAPVLRLRQTGAVVVEADLVGEDDLGDRKQISYRVRDAEHPGVEVVLTYLVAGRETAATVRLLRFKVGVEPEDAEVGLSASTIREYPIARWDNVARQKLVGPTSTNSPNLVAAALDLLKALDMEPSEMALSIVLDTLALALVRAYYPNLPAARGAVAARSRKSLTRLARVAVLYQYLIAQGKSDPASEIARQHDISSATARSWVHRARKAGFLGPAVGPTAGVSQDRTDLYQRAEDDEAAATLTHLLSQASPFNVVAADPPLGKPVGVPRPG